MNMHTWDAWMRIVRDTAIVSVGTFMLIFETVFAANPNAYLIAAGLAALGLPPALRLDLRSSGRRVGDDTHDPPRRPRPGDDDYDDLSGWGG
jgi:hypothetical protein